MAIYNYPLSPSSITTYINCPYSFFLKYIKRIKIPASAAAIFGSYIHKVNEDFWSEYSTDIEKSLEASIIKNSNIKIDDEYKETSVLCLNNFVGMLKDSTITRPLYIEHRTENNLNNTVAIIDVVFPQKIVDYKTSSQYTKKPKDANIIQAVMCSENLKACTGLEVKHIEFWFLRFKKYQYVEINDELIKETNDLIEQIRNGIKIDHFPKNEKSCWMCDYRLICESEKKAIQKSKKDYVKNRTSIFL